MRCQLTRQPRYAGAEARLAEVVEDALLHFESGNQPLDEIVRPSVQFRHETASQVNRRPGGLKVAGFRHSRRAEQVIDETVRERKPFAGGQGTGGVPLADTGQRVPPMDPSRQPRVQ